MRIELATIKPQGMRIEIGISARALADWEAETGEESGLTLGAPISGWVEIGPVKDGLRVAGRLTAKLKAECGRCLAPVAEDLEIDLDLKLVKSFGVEESEYRLAREELDQDQIDGEELDLTGLVVEQIALNREMALLCDPQCRGLCPGCGADLNRAECGCEKTEIDPRLAVLAQWGADQDKKES